MAISLVAKFLKKISSEPGYTWSRKPSSAANKVRALSFGETEGVTRHRRLATRFWHPDGAPMSAQQFMEALFGKLPEFFQNEDELRAL